MNPSLSHHLFDLGSTLARADAMAYVAHRQPKIVVQPTELSASGVQLAATPHEYPRCHADVFTDNGILTITTIDGGDVVREYVAGEWLEAVAFNADGHIAYSLRPRERRQA